MAIHLAADMRHEKLRIDLTGPEGNVFVLMGYAMRLSKQLGKDGKAILARMSRSNYDHAVAVFDAEFGEYVDLYR